MFERQELCGNAPTAPERARGKMSPTRDPSAPVVPWSDGEVSPPDSGEDRAVVPKFQAARWKDPFPSYVPPHEGCCGESPFIDR